MATGAGGVNFLSNLPADRFRMDPALFNESTERQDIPQATTSWGGFGSAIQIRLQNVGVVSLVKLYCELTYKTGATAPTGLNPGFPYSIVKRVSFNANGQTSLIQARGTTLRARRNRIYRNPAESVEAITTSLAASTSYTQTFILDVPIAHDSYTNLGSILAQNPATYLSLEILFASESEVFQGSPTAMTSISGSVYATLTTFAVGQTTVGNQQGVTILPDLTVFHGLLDNTFPFASTGIVQAPLIRTAGQLVNYAMSIYNGTEATNKIPQIEPKSLSEIAFKYGGNRQPRVYTPVGMLLDENQQNYNGLIEIGPSGKKLTYTYLDFEVSNASRDLFVPEALVELQAQIQIPTSVTVNSGAYILYVEESLYPAV